MSGTKPYLVDLICGLADRGVQFILCGGMAAVYHGVERMTMDVDISLHMEAGNVRRFLAAMQEMKLTRRPPVPAKSLLSPEKVALFVREKKALVFTFWDVECPYRQVDVFLDPELSYQRLIHADASASS